MVASPPESPLHVRLLTEYAEGVKAGSIVACKWVKLACARHFADLEKSRTDPDYPYYFDEHAADRICRFGEFLPHVKGEWAKKTELIVFSGWQSFILGVAFGWKRKSDDRRRFREMYCEIPRKNGKSVFGAVIGNYMFCADDEFGAEVYSGATTEKQAWEVYGPAQLMMQRSPDIVEETGIQMHARGMTRPDDMSKFFPLIGKPGDGASPSCAIIDEFHEHPTSELYDTMNTGTGARAQPMVCIITTAGVSLAGPCYDKHTQMKKVLEGTLENDELFGIIFTIDEGDDWAHPDALRKANPNFGVSVGADFLLSQQRQAVLNAEYQNRFKTKHLDVWCGASVAGINLHAWKLAGDKGLLLEDFAGERAWFALDLASKLDICCYAKIFTKWIGTDLHYYAFLRHYLPERTIEEATANQSSYRKWVAQGHLTPTPGAEIDFDIIRDDVKQDSVRFQCNEVVYDPWRATQLAHQLMNDGATVVEMGQTAKNMGAAFDELNSAIKSGRFHHDGDPVLEWMASNVIAKPVTKGLMMPSKQKNEQKIDGIVAVLMGISRAMAESQTGNFADWMNDPVTVG